MSGLTLKLFGSPEVLIDGEPVTGFHSAKSRLLLYYLATVRRSHSRTSLAGFLWGDLPDKNASNNLRKSLTNLRKLVNGYLSIDRESVAFASVEYSQIDVQEFETLAGISSAAISDLEKAAAFYRGDFLEGFYVRDAPEIEKWILGERARLRKIFHTLLLRLIKAHHAAGNSASSLEAAQRLLALDPLQENVHRLLMKLYAELGQRSQALAQYEACVTLLAAELDLPPEPETLALYKQIFTGTLQTQSAASSLLEKADARDSDRDLLGEKVRRFWIDGVLHHAYHLTAPLHLNWAIDLSMVDHPWADLPSSPPAQTPASKALGLLDTFYAADRALLILGTAGAGKTISLLNLADELLQEAAADPLQPTPIVLPLSSWSNSKAPLDQWIVAQLTIRYQIPARLGQRWLFENKLVLMLDGLDEVRRSDQADCMKAINHFRDLYGLTGLVVCCRKGVISAQETKLRLGSALELQPLTLSQAKAYLAHAAPQLQTLQESLSRHAWLQEMIQSPLLLNLLAVSWQDQNGTMMTRNKLLQRFVDDAFTQRPTQNLAQTAQAKSILQWLSGSMGEHNLTVYYLELMQPSWLNGRRSRLIYLFLTRLLIVGFLGVGMALLYRAGTLDQPQFRLELFAIAGSWLPLESLWQETIGFMILAQMHWVFATVIDFWWFERRRRHMDEMLFSRKQALLLILLHAVVSLGYIVLAALPFDSAVISFFAGTLHVYFLTVALGYWSYSQSYRTDIRPSASLGWSWRGAGLGGLFGLTLGLIFTALGNPLAYILLVIPAAVITGGLRRIGLEQSFRPNQGIYATARNALIGGLTQGAVPLLLFGWTSPAEFTLLTSLVAAGIGSLLFGGATLIKHGILRLLLYLERGLPFNLADFLDDLSRTYLIRRIGGGYIFFHQLLQDYFATSDFSNPVNSPKSADE